MLERASDAGFANQIVNHPDVRPFVGPMDAGEVDLSPLVDRPEHWFLMGEHGGFALLWTAPRTYEWHTFIVPDGRGKWAAEARTEAIRYARTHGAKTLWAKIPPDSPHVARYARQGGMQPSGEMIETLGTLYRVYSMELG